MDLKEYNKYIIKAKAIVTMNNKLEILTPGVIAIKNNEIAFIGKEEDLPMKMKNDYKILNRNDHILMPGLVNTHTHSNISLWRGLADDEPVGEWFSGPMKKLNANTKTEDYYWSSKLGLLEMIRFGVTCIADRSFFNDFGKVYQAIDESGIRAVLAQNLRMEYGESMLNRALEEINLRKDKNKRITFGLGPHATDTCSIEFLNEVRKVASELKLPVFLHAAQTQEEISIAKSRGYQGSIDMLYKNGFLDEDVIMAHCIYINKNEIDQVIDSGAWISHCPKSNIRIEAQTIPSWKLIDKGVNIVLGTDAACCNNVMDMFEEMRFTTIIQKLLSNDPTILPPKVMMKMATIKGAESLGLDNEIGSLEIGKKADIISLKLDYHLRPLNDIYSNIVYSARGNDVYDVIVDGKFLMKERSINLEKQSIIIDESEKRSARIRQFL